MIEKQPIAEHEEILYPELEICDPHQHFFASPDFSYMPEDMMKDIEGGHKVVRTVYLNCHTGYRTTGPEKMKPVGETEYVERIIGNYKGNNKVKFADGMVGFADLILGDEVDAVLAAHVEIAPKRIRGIRSMAIYDSDPAISSVFRLPYPRLLMESSFRKGYSYLKKYNLSFDILILHTQIPDLFDLAKAFPDTPIILNHTGNPLGIGRYAGHQEEVMAEWKKNMAELSECENVYIKVGGLGMDLTCYGYNEMPKPIGSEAAAKAFEPYFMWCVEKFGVKRCMFESNFPVDKEMFSYDVLWNIFKRLTADFSNSEKQALFHDTAVKAYRLGL